MSTWPASIAGPQSHALKVPEVCDGGSESAFQLALPLEAVVDDRTSPTRLDTSSRARQAWKASTPAVRTVFVGGSIAGRVVRRLRDHLRYDLSQWHVPYCIAPSGQRWGDCSVDE